MVGERQQRKTTAWSHAIRVSARRDRFSSCLVSLRSRAFRSPLSLARVKQENDRSDYSVERAVLPGAEDKRGAVKLLARTGRASAPGIFAHFDAVVKTKQKIAGTRAGFSFVLVPARCPGGF